MSDQEITDRDETRRLAYVALAVADYRVRDARLHELIGTLAHALAHHAGGLQGRDGTEIVRAITSGIFDGDLRMAEEIDALTEQIRALKRPAPLVTADDVEAIPDTPRRTFLKVVYAAFDNVANDPDARWFEGDSSGDTMHEIEVALDAYVGFLTRLGGAEDAPWVAQAEVDLAQALDLLGQVLQGPSPDRRIDVPATARWVAQARARQAERTP